MPDRHPGRAPVLQAWRHSAVRLAWTGEPLTSATTLLVNPVAGLGRAAHRADRAYAALRTIGPVVVVETQCAGDERRIAADAARTGTRAVVVLGGDGAVSQAARGLLDAGSTVPLAVFPAGTGNDFAKSLGIRSHDYLRIARAIATGMPHRIDVGEMDGVPFVNAAGLGFDVAVLQHMQRPARWLRGPSRYVGTALRHLAGYPGTSVGVSSLNAGARQPYLTVVFANGQWFGGAFHIAPAATLDSGRLQCVAIGDVPVLTRTRLLLRALRGTHVGKPGTWDAHASSYTVSCETPPVFQADGELYQARASEVTVRTHPGALLVVKVPELRAR